MARLGFGHANSARSSGSRSVMRHVEHPPVRHRVVGEVKHLLACWAVAAHAIIGPVLLAVVDRVDGGRRIGGTHPPAIHEVPRLEDLRHRPLRPLPAELCRRAVGTACDRDGMAVPMRHAYCSAPLREGARMQGTPSRFAVQLVTGTEGTRQGVRRNSPSPRRRRLRHGGAQRGLSPVRRLAGPRETRAAAQRRGRLRPTRQYGTVSAGAALPAPQASRRSHQPLCGDRSS